MGYRRLSGALVRGLSRSRAAPPCSALYLHYGESYGFWINLAIQSLATLWLLQLTLRVLGLMQTFRFVAISLLLILSTALPWLASMLLTDIFAGLSVLSLFILIVGGSRISGFEKVALFVFTAFAAATHSATLGVLLGLCVAGWMMRPYSQGPPANRRIDAGEPDHRCWRPDAGIGEPCAVGQWAWTPGGTGVAFGRMMQDGIVHPLPQRSLPQRELQAVSLSQPIAGDRRRVPVGHEHVQHARPVRGHE